MPAPGSGRTHHDIVAEMSAGLAQGLDHAGQIVGLDLKAVPTASFCWHTAVISRSHLTNAFLEGIHIYLYNIP